MIVEKLRALLNLYTGTNIEAPIASGISRATVINEMCFLFNCDCSNCDCDCDDDDDDDDDDDWDGMNCDCDGPPCD